ncbi:aminotransferase class IV [Staphylococcus canis]|uniref:Aminotransferase class IV n=1 Tax=Staphylococcus canis TaxID=2724942 RepID=A0ABS0T5L1_9STAP|nr:aminotransferase class IV [Staphylococcus canis]MBI5974028.1 aminotransferase class IV [Staphylococcus canis]
MYVFETMRLEQGQISRYDYHYQRIRRASTDLNIPFDNAKWNAMMTSIQSHHLDGTYRIKAMLEENGKMHYDSQALPETQVMTARLKRINSNVPTWQRVYKTSHRDHLTHTKATQLILLYEESGKVLEFDIGNLVVEYNGDCYTPTLNDDFLNGCMRQALIDQNKIQVKNITIDFLQEALQNGAKLWMINSLREWVPVVLDTNE